jgi:hypothetical protein
MRVLLLKKESCVGENMPIEASSVRCSEADGTVGQLLRTASNTLVVVGELCMPAVSTMEKPCKQSGLTASTRPKEARIHPYIRTSIHPDIPHPLSFTAPHRHPQSPAAARSSKH